MATFAPRNQGWSRLLALITSAKTRRYQSCAAAHPAPFDSKNEESDSNVFCTHASCKHEWVRNGLGKKWKHQAVRAVSCRTGGLFLHMGISLAWRNVSWRYALVGKTFLLSLLHAGHTRIPCD